MFPSLRERMDNGDDNTEGERLPIGGYWYWKIGEFLHVEAINMPLAQWMAKEGIKELSIGKEPSS